MSKLNQVQLKYASKGLEIVKDLITSVLESGLSTSQKKLLSKTLMIVIEIQSVID